MKQLILLVAIVVFVIGGAFAHGTEQHIMGIVTGMTDTSITVQTTAKDPITVYSMPETKYEKDGAVSGMKELKLGDRVVVHAAKMGAKLMAHEVRFGSFKQGVVAH